MKTVTLGEIAKISSGGTPSRSEKSYWGGNIPWVTTSLIQNGIIKEDDIEEWITDEGMKHSSAKMVPAGTILMAMYGQGKTRGQVAILDIDATINQACVAITLNDGINKDFVYQQLLYRYDNIRKLSNNGSQENLNAGLIRYIGFPLGSLTEQTKIANTLTTYDNAIKTTEQLIGVKERYFRELSKKLFTLQESENWTEVKLGTVCDISKGVQLSRSDMIENAIYPVLNGGIQPSGYTDEWNTESNTITISEGGNSCGFVSYMTQNFWCGGHCYALKQAQISKEYLYHYLKANEKAIMSLRVGSGLPNIQKKALGHFQIKYPKDEVQQIKIAEILNTAKREIDLFKSLAISYRVQKRGLMQKLLSGEWKVAE